MSQHHPAYNVSKAAAIHLSNMLGAEIVDAGLKIRVNNIAPGKRTTLIIVSCRMGSLTNAYRCVPK